MAKIDKDNVEKNAAENEEETVEEDSAETADEKAEAEEEQEFEGVESIREEAIEACFDILNSFLDEGNYQGFSEMIETVNPIDAADFFLSLEPKKIPMVFKHIKKDYSAELFAELDSDLQKRIIEALTDREILRIVNELFIDDTVDLLNELPANIVTSILKRIDPEKREAINSYLAYPESSAGSIMTAEFIDLKENWTCGESIEHIRKTGIDKETVYTAYVTDEKRILMGTVSFKELLFANPKEMVSEIMSNNPICVATVDDREYAADLVSKYGLLALPVVDKEMRLVGIVTVDDAIDVIREETTEDIEIMAAITPSDKSYMKTGVFSTWRKRFPWLLILMLSAIFSSAIITHYESAIGTYAILTAFVPMLMNTGGNAGSQSSVAIIRAMSLDEIEKRDFFKVIWKEFRVSLLCGACLAAVCFVKTMLVDFRLQAQTVMESGAIQNNLVIAAIVSATAFFAVVVAKIIGSILPMAAKKIGLDPAVMASPFISTIVDAVTLIIYFAIASQALHL